MKLVWELKLFKNQNGTNVLIGSFLFTSKKRAWGASVEYLKAGNTIVGPRPIKVY